MAVAVDVTRVQLFHYFFRASTHDRDAVYPGIFRALTLPQLTSELRIIMFLENLPITILHLEIRISWSCRCDGKFTFGIDYPSFKLGFIFSLTVVALPKRPRMAREV